MPTRKHFGTDGIRGRVGVGPISADFALRLGRAAGRVLVAAGGDGSVLIGKDTRLSGYMFEAALEAGLIAGGARVRLLGPMPTPAVAQLTRATGASGGVVISASHNPHEDNGFKFFSGQGEKLSDALESAIEAELEAPFDTVPPELLGRATRMNDAPQRYLGFCRGTVPEEFSLTGLRLVLDCAHGATYKVAPRLLSDLGAEIGTIGAAPTGLNINHGVGTMHPEGLVAAVASAGADLGIAFDGDGDRVLFVDGNGHVRDGDDLIHLLALDWHASGRLRGPVVGTLMTNFGIEQSLRAHGIGFRRSNVGDRYVHQALVEHGGVLGGEASGHILCLDRAKTGDGLVSALQVLEVMQRRGLSLAALCAGLKRYPQRTVNVRVAAGSRPAEHASVTEARARAERALEGRGRVVLRASGTEPVVRVTVEAEDDDLVARWVAELSDTVRAALD